MSRRSLFSDRNSLSRRVLGMMSSLFRRKWTSAIHSVRRARLARWLTQVADDVRDALAASAASATNLKNTHLLTLTPAEFLERRAVMDVGARARSESGSMTRMRKQTPTYAKIRTVRSLSRKAPASTSAVLMAFRGRISSRHGQA